MRKALGALTLLSAGMLAVAQPTLAQTTQGDIPANPTGPIVVPSTGDSNLVLSVWSPTLPLSLVYNTGLLYSQVEQLDLTPESGVVLDFGVIPDWSVFDGNTGNLQYHLIAADGNGTLPNTGFVTTAALGLPGWSQSNGSVTSVVGTNGAGNFFGQVNNSCGATNPCLYDANTPALSSNPDAEAQSWGARYNGALNVDASGTVGSALGFYYVDAQTGGATGAAVVTPFENTSGLGTWLLTSEGQLTYTIAGVSEVPLPAALWLLFSGLAGFGVISRRRSA